MLPDDWESEELLSVAAAAKRLGKSPQTVTAYIRQGLSVGGGRRVYLECVTVGTLHTSVEALRRFVERCSPAPKGQPQRTPAEARKAGQRAMDTLRKELAT
jgi:hypothetical protein